MITANKALLATYGDEIFRAAVENGVDIGFEASVGGTIPIIKTLRESLVGNRIRSIFGIMNGTSNYILTKMTDEDLPFEEALRTAQELGFAEADPTYDIEGIDTAHKLAISLSLAYGKRVRLEDIYREGISGISGRDVEFARELGYKIKLLAIAFDRGDFVEARIHPTMIPFDHLLANVSGNFNAFHFIGDASGSVFLYGQGAGMDPTASSVVCDLADIARDMLCGISGRVPPVLPGGPDRRHPHPAHGRNRDELFFPVHRRRPARCSLENIGNPGPPQYQHRRGDPEGTEDRRRRPGGDDHP